MPHESDRILVVDDDEGIRDALGSLLEGEGYEVVCVENGRAALEYLSCAGRPCLILLDLMMPVMDGWTFMAARTAHPELASIPVVVITAAGEQREGALEGAPVLRKPLRLERLLGTIEQYC
jgi:CheY-like chemotaxis protein